MYYKVVNNSLQSAVISLIGDDFIKENFNIQYLENAWVYPKVKCAKLMVFNNLTDAKRFLLVELNNNGLIYTCDVINPKNQGRFVHGIGFSTGRLRDLYKSFKHKKKINISICQGGYNGTVFCDAIKLLNKVSEI